MPLSSQIEEYKKLIMPIIALLREEARSAQAKKAFADRYSKHLQSGETLPDVNFVLELLSRELEGTQGNAEGADQAYALEESDDPAVRQAVEDALLALYDEVVQLRSEINAAYGEGAINALGMQGDTTRVPARLERHARTVAERLKDGKISLGKSKSVRMSLDRKAAAETLMTLCDGLAVTLLDLNREKAELLQKQDERNRALTLWEEIVPSNCAAARGLLLLAGDVEGAGRITSTPKRRVSSTGPEVTTSETPDNPETGE
jgi:AcrR family transcriptional regulator